MSAGWLGRGACRRLALACLVLAFSFNEWLVRTWIADGLFWSVGQRVATALVQVALLAAGGFFLLTARTGVGPAKGLSLALRRYPRASGLALGCVPLFLMAAAVAVVSRLTASSAAGIEIVDLDSGRSIERFSQEDSLLGYRPVPGLRVAVRKIADGAVVYEAHYQFDEHSRRLTPVQGGERGRFVLFMGGSFTFGEGVDDDQTLPCYFGQFSPESRPYNYGFSGYGTQQMLALLEEGLPAKEIAEEEGTLYYVYLPFHINRVIGSLQVFNSWGAFMPYYVLDETGAPRREGNFTSGRPFTSLVYWTAGKLRLPSVFGRDFPRLTEAHLDLTAALIESSRHKFEALFPGSRFVVVMFPRRGTDNRMIQRLRRRGTAFIDCQGAFDPDDEDLRIPHDGHPTAEAYRLVAQRLSEEAEKEQKDRPQD